MTKEELERKRHSDIMELMGKTHDGVESVQQDVSALSTSFQLHEQKDDMVHNGYSNRISSLEEAAEATGAHEIVRLESALEKSEMSAKDAADKWKGRLWGIFAALLLAAISAGAGAYFHP
jgi:hypothetical protein